MPIPKTYRVNPIDLQPNVAVGIKLPMNGPAVFYSTYTTKDQVKYNMINLLLTNRGERVENPNFGSDVKKFVFELIIDENTQAVRDLVIASITAYIPEVILEAVDVNSDPDRNAVTINVRYRMKLSGDKDNLTINFE